MKDEGKCEKKGKNEINEKLELRKYVKERTTNKKN